MERIERRGANLARGYDSSGVKSIAGDRKFAASLPLFFFPSRPAWRTGLAVAEGEISAGRRKERGRS